MINKKYLKNLRCKEINDKNDFILDLYNERIIDSLDVINIKFKKILKKTDLRKGGGADTGKIGQLRSKLATTLDKNKRLQSKKQESNQKIKKLTF